MRKNEKIDNKKEMKSIQKQMSRKKNYAAERKKM